jgi:hypothetical protein
MVNGAIHSMFQVMSERITPRAIAFSRSDLPARISIELACLLAQMIANQEQIRV